MSNTKQFLENILKESDEVPYCDDVNCEPVKESKNNNEKTVKVMAYGKVYYEYPEDEWKYMTDDVIDSLLDDTAFQASEEEGHTVEKDEVEIVTESEKVTEAKDDLEGIKNLIVYEKTQDIFEELYHNKHLDCEYNGSNGVVKITSADEQTFNIIDKVMVDKLHYSKLSNYVYELNEGPIYRDIKGGFDFKGYSYKVDVKFTPNEKDTIVGTVGISEINVKKESKNLTEDITSKDVDEIFSKYAEIPVTVKNFKQKWANASDNNRNPVYAGGWSAIIIGDNFKININNSLKLNGYKISGENLDNAEKIAKNIYSHSADIGYETNLYKKSKNNLHESEQEEPVNDFEKLSPEVQQVLNDMSSSNSMYKWIIDDIMDSDIEGYNGDTFDEKLKNRLNEIVDHGCESGTVGSLIYYTDTVKFFDNFYDEIYDMVDDIFGAESTLEMLQRHCELIDIIMGADTVKNYLAWMAYEVTCSNILDSMESA